MAQKCRWIILLCSAFLSLFTLARSASAKAEGEPYDGSRRGGFEVVSQSTVSGTILKIQEGCSFGKLREAYGQQFQRAAGRPLTPLNLYAVNPDTMLIVCLPDKFGGRPTVGRPGHTEVWDGCPADRQSAWLQAGALVKIPRHQVIVETYAERQARLDKLAACVSKINVSGGADTSCLNSILTPKAAAAMISSASAQPVLGGATPRVTTTVPSSSPSASVNTVQAGADNATSQVTGHIDWSSDGFRRALIWLVVGLVAGFSLFVVFLCLLYADFNFSAFRTSLLDILRDVKALLRGDLTRLRVENGNMRACITRLATLADVNPLADPATPEFHARIQSAVEILCLAQNSAVQLLQAELRRLNALNATAQSNLCKVQERLDAVTNQLAVAGREASAAKLTLGTARAALEAECSAHAETRDQLATAQAATASNGASIQLTQSPWDFVEGLLVNGSSASTVKVRSASSITAFTWVARIALSVPMPAKLRDKIWPAGVAFDAQAIGIMLTAPLEVAPVGPS